MKLSVIDIGSNTVKTSVFETAPEVAPIEVTRKTIPAGLIGHIESGVLTDIGRAILIGALDELVAFTQSCGCAHENIYPFATASLRAASNFDEIKRDVADKLSLDIDLISGEREAALTFRALVDSIGQGKDGLLLDLGGGSTEMIVFSSSRLERGVSIPIGALVLYRKFVKNILPTKSECSQIASFVRESFGCSDFLSKAGGSLYINGGSGRALANLHHSLSSADGSLPALPYEFSRDALVGIIDRACECDDVVKQTMLRVLPTRIHTVIPAAVAIMTVMDAIDIDKIIVTDAGIRRSYAAQIANEKGIL